MRTLTGARSDPLVTLIFTVVLVVLIGAVLWALFGRGR